MKKKILTFLCFIFMTFGMFTGCSGFVMDDESLYISNITSQVLEDGTTMVTIIYTDDEIADYITGYYDDVEQIREIYGDEANQIIAECIFECLPAIEHTFVKEMKFEADAIDFIHKFIENH